MIDGLSVDLKDRLVGVIDLKDGLAVHAVGGHRDVYRPVAFCGGDSVALAKYYLHIGVSRVYVADLDALGGRSPQLAAVKSIVSLGFREALVDIGWSGAEPGFISNALSSVAEQLDSCCWIAATESCTSMDSLGRLVQLVGCRNVAVSFDFRRGEFQTRGPTLVEWREGVQQSGIMKAVVLDVAAVGTSEGPATISLCQLLRSDLSGLQLYSGGGIRHLDDLQQVISAGCKGVLLATALYPSE